MLYLLFFPLAFTVCSGGTVGVSSPGSFTSDIDSSGVGYLLEDETYQVMCCGYISAWQYGASGPGTVVLQIWRKIGTKAYTLIGKNTATIGKDILRYTLDILNLIKMRSPHLFISFLHDKKKEEQENVRISNFN